MGHALTYRIARIQRVRLGKTDLIVPRFRPRTTSITGQPQAVAGFHIVIPKCSRHEKTLHNLCKAGDGIAGVGRLVQFPGDAIAGFTVPQSGWADSNRRPSDPQSDALTKLRYSP